MRKTAKLGTVLAIAVATSGAGYAIAYANWSIRGGISVEARSAKMPRGVTPSVVKQGKKAIVSWSAQQVGAGARMKSYIVTAYSVGDPSRADVRHSVLATGTSVESITFKADEVVDGRWYWTLVPKYGEWTGEASRASERLDFRSGPAASLVADSASPSPSETPTDVSVDPPQGAAASSESPTDSVTDPKPSTTPMEITVTSEAPTSDDPRPSESESSSTSPGSAGQGASATVDDAND